MFNTLAKKILAAMILMTLTCSVAFTAVSFYQIQNSVINQMKSDSITLVTSLRREMAKYGVDDLSKMQEVFAEIKKESGANISYISLADSNMNIIISDDARGGSGDINTKQENNNDSTIDTVSSATTQGDASGSISGEKVSGFIFKTPEGERVYNISAPFTIDSDFKGTLNIGISLKGMYKQVKRTLMEIIIIVIIIQIVTVLIGLVIARTLTKPMGVIMRKLEDFEKGDFSIEFKSSSKDELGRLTSMLNRSVSVLREAIVTVKNTVNDIYETAAFITGSGDEAAAFSEEVTQEAGEVASVIERQNSNITAITAALEHFDEKLGIMLTEVESVLKSGSRIQETADNGYNELNNLVNSTSDVREAFNAAVREITELHDSIGKINEIVDVINNVAEQTNLLALNAAIESARAGEAGRGFSVVAEEIRKLAEQVMRSSKTINQLIKTISANANEVVASSKLISDKMDAQMEIAKNTVVSCDDIRSEIDGSMRQMSAVSGSMDEIGSEKENIMLKIDEIAGISGQISGSAQEIAASTQSQSANLQQLSNMAQDLNETANKLKKSVELFKV